MKKTSKIEAPDSNTELTQMKIENLVLKLQTLPTMLEAEFKQRLQKENVALQNELKLQVDKLRVAMNAPADAMYDPRTGTFRLPPTPASPKK